MQPKLSRERNKIALKDTKPKAWSHQDDLKALVGKGILIKMLDGHAMECTLIAADQFTLKVLSAESDFAITVFKSSVSYFVEQAQ